MVSLKNSFSLEFKIKNIIFEFSFFVELSRLKVSFDHGIFGSLLLTLA